MMSDERVWNLIVLNSSLENGDELIAGLEASGDKFHATYAVSLEHFEKSLINDTWDLIIALDTDNPNVSLKQALSFRSSSPTYLAVPFLVITPEASTHAHIKWMSTGASDVVEEYQYEHLVLVVNRELQRIETTKEKQKKEEQKGRVLDHVSELLTEQDDNKKGKLFVQIELKDWNSICSRFNDEKLNIVEDTILAEVENHLSDDCESELSDNGLVSILENNLSGSPEELARMIAQGFDKLFIDVDDKSLQVGAAIACVPLEYPAKNNEEILGRVDELLQVARTKGVNKFAVYCPETELQRQASEGDAYALVQHALDHQSFELMFQPVASLRGDEEEHYDVLLRILNPEGKQIVARQFMGAIDKSELAEKIDKWVILQSIKQLLAHNEQGKTSHLFLHLSGASIQDKKFLPWLYLLLKKTGIEPGSLVFQLDEEKVARAQEQALHLLQGMKKIGCRTSLCRFGSTMNPMRIAKDFITNYIKLDGKMTLELAENPDQEKPLREMIEALQKMGRKTIVPSIESPNVMTRVWRTGSDYVQGYFLQKPKPEMDYDFSSDD